MELKAALAKLSQRAATDPAFRQELEKDAAAAITRETGLTLDELRQHIQQLSEDELAEVAGGFGLGDWAARKWAEQIEKNPPGYRCPRCGAGYYSQVMLDIHTALFH